MVEPVSRKGYAGAFGADAARMSESTFSLLRGLIEQRTGVFYSEAKSDQLESRLSDLLAARGMTSYLDYYYLLRYDADAERHLSELLDALAVPETFFWRQADQILALATIIAPRHFAQRPAAPLRIWSAACCTGEEPISIAIALAEAGLLFTRPIEIIASDASEAMIARARNGVYGERSFRTLPAPLRDRYFRKEPSGWRVDPHVHCKVQWTTANLVEPADVRRLAAVDVIFCRNVFIYFADDTIARVVRVFADELADDGFLFLGAAESLTRLATAFELDEVGSAFVYVKRPRGRSSRPAP